MHNTSYDNIDTHEHGILLTYDINKHTGMVMAHEGHYKLVNRTINDIHPGVQLIDWMNCDVPTNEIVLPVIKPLSDWSSLDVSTNHMPKIHTPG